MNVIETLLIDLLGRRNDNFDWRGRQPSLDLLSVESVCVLQHNHKVGDAILISLLVDALARARPGLTIYVGAPTAFGPYWSQHPGVARAIAFDPGRGLPFPVRAWRGWRTAREWRGRFDVAVSFQSFARIEHFALLRLLQPRTAIGFGKDAYALFDYSLEEHRHGVDLAPAAVRARSVMRVFGLEVELASLSPHVPFGPEDQARALEALRLPLSRGRRLLINAYGADRMKRLSPESVCRIVEEARRCGHSGPIFVSVPEGAERAYEAVLAAEVALGTAKVLGPQDGLSSLFALVASVDVVISPDTAVGHVAAAFGKPQVCLFARGGSVPTIWKPFNSRCYAVVSESGKSVNDLDWFALGEAVRGALSHAEAAREYDVASGKPA